MESTENEFAKLWLEDGIVFFVYKPGSIITLEAAEKVVSDRLALQKDVSFPAFCDMRGIKDSRKPARDFLAKEGSKLVTAVAVLVESPLTRVMLNLYLSINKPITPTKMFTDKSQALEYLRAFVNSDART